MVTLTSYRKEKFDFLKFYEIVRDSDFLFYDLLKESMPLKEVTLKKYLARLVAMGKFVRIKKGFYVNNVKDINPYKLANALFEGYVSLASALYLHKLIDEKPFEIVVLNPHSDAKYKYKEYTIKGLVTDELYGSTLVEGVLVATKAKAIYDCIRLKACELSKILDCLKQLSSEDIDELIGYAKTKSMFKKIAFLLFLSGNPSKNLKQIFNKAKKIKTKIYVGTGPNKKYFKEWGVILCDFSIMANHKGWVD